MADTDFKSSLPVRSEIDGTDERVHVKIVDGTTSPAVNQVKVDADNALKTLATGHDPGGVNRTVRTSERGAVTPDGVYDAANNTVPGNVGVIASQRSATPGDATQTRRLTSVVGTGSENNKISLDVSIHDDSGNAWTTSNPIPVTIVDPALIQTDVFQSVDALAIAAGSSGNLDYTITAGKTSHLYKVACSGSGRMKFELQVSADGVTFNRMMVKYNSTSEPNVDFEFAGRSKAQAAGTGGKFRVIATNLDHAAFDAHALFVAAEQ